MKKNRLILLFFSIFAGFVSQAQDPSLSQYYFNQTYFSPALAGIHGGSNLNLTYRRQWANLPGKFETVFFNFDTDISAMKGLGGVGINIYKDVQGEGFLTTLGASLMLNSRIHIRQNSFLQAGVSISVYNKTIDWSKLIFGDQIDNLYGVMPRPSKFYSANDHSNIFPDVSIGIVYAFGQGPRKHVFSNNYNAKIGVAFHHINQPNESFLDQTSKLPMKMVIHANLNIGLNRDATLILSPCMVYEYQQAFRMTNSDLKTLYAGYNLLWNNFFIGNWIRLFNNSDALIFNAGIITGGADKGEHRFKMYYSYDVTISGLNSSSTGGSHEISLAYFFDDVLTFKKHRKRIKQLACPDP